MLISVTYYQIKMRKYYKLLRWQLEEHSPYEISIKAEWQEDILDVQTLGKYTPCALFLK